MLSYRKSIVITDTGMVIARVFSDGGRRVGLEFFDPLIATNAAIERKAKKAHKWADGLIKVCERHEC